METENFNAMSVDSFSLIEVATGRGKGSFLAGEAGVFLHPVDSALSVGKIKTMIILNPCWSLINGSRSNMQIYVLLRKQMKFTDGAYPNSVAKYPNTRLCKIIQSGPRKIN